MKNFYLILVGLLLVSGCSDLKEIDLSEGNYDFSDDSNRLYCYTHDRLEICYASASCEGAIYLIKSNVNIDDVLIEKNWRIRAQDEFYEEVSELLNLKDSIEFFYKKYDYLINFNEIYKRGSTETVLSKLKEKTTDTKDSCFFKGMFYVSNIKKTKIENFDVELTYWVDAYYGQGEEISYTTVFDGNVFNGAENVWNTLIYNDDGFELLKSDMTIEETIPNEEIEQFIDFYFDDLGKFKYKEFLDEEGVRNDLYDKSNSANLYERDVFAKGEDQGAG